MRKSKQEIGVIIESGASDWQIFQQNAAGVATIRLTGRWLTQTASSQSRVYVRLLNESDYTEPSLSLNWRLAETGVDGTWSADLPDVPRGGLYRIETGLRHDDAPIEWIQRGDMVHHLGVGDIWMITGQSNSSGYGKTPAHDPPELGIHMFHACGEWRLATHPLSDSTSSQYVANRENANGSHAPWLAFARKLKEVLGYPIGLIPAALGGSPLQAWARSGGGHLFDNMLGYFQDSGASSCRGAVWYQGESDTSPELRAIYAERFREFHTDLRRELRNPDLHIITVQLNRYIGEDVDKPVHANWDAMRELQRHIARTTPGVSIISTLDLGLSDGIHNDSSGNLTIGQRCAAAALGAVYGYDIKYRHPDLEEIHRIDDQTLDLHFANVDTRLHYESRLRSQLPFAVSDSLGPVEIADYELTGSAIFRLRLARPLQGAATVTGAPGACPPSVVPFDICGYRPMLAFTSSTAQ